jgi:hypothetical protein
VIGRPAWGLIKVRYCTLFTPLTSSGPEAMAELSRINPVEIMVNTGLRDGELDLYAAYAGKDEFNIDAQVESFLWVARERSISVAVDYDPKGKHDIATGARLFPAAIRWVAPRVPAP